MKTADLTLDTMDGQMAAFEARPDGDALGAVIVVQEAFGVNAHIRSVVTRLADAGYHALAPSYFHRVDGDPIEDYTNFAAIFPLFDGLTDDGILIDTDAAIAHLVEAGFSPEQIGIVGFCFGGRVTFLVSLNRTLGAAVGFYGGGISTKGVLPFPALIGEAAALQTPWLGLFGDEDASIPVEGVEELRTALTAASLPTNVIRYPGAGHGFHCDVRADYHEDAAQDAWSQTLAWFGLHLQG